jgi:creatinine amidohydrolase
VTEDTGVGNPAAATPEKGRRFLEAVVERVSGFLVDLASADLGKMYE